MLSRLSRFISLFLTLLIFGLVTKAQIITVVDESGQPLEMVTLASAEPDSYTTTNGKGEADISMMNGAENIEIRMLGFNTEILSYKELSSISRLKMKSAGLSLDQVVVSATRWNQSKREVPGRISTL